MDNISGTRQPLTLWFETLPSDDTARLVIRPLVGHVTAGLFWNEELHTERIFLSQDAAEAWGYELRDVLLQDALAGALLGYDAEVLERLQAQCSST